MAIIKTTDKMCIGKDVEKLEFSCIAGGNVKWYSRFGKQSGSSPKRLNIQSPRSSTLRHIPKRKQTCPQMFTAAPFIIAKKWKQC